MLRRRRRYHIANTQADSGQIVGRRLLDICAGAVAEKLHAGVERIGNIYSLETFTDLTGMN